MYRIGALVVHPDYGLGTFHGIHGDLVRIAIIHFRGRGSRRIILPSPRLRSVPAAQASLPCAPGRTPFASCNEG